MEQNEKREPSEEGMGGRPLGVKGRRDSANSGASHSFLGTTLHSMLEVGILEVVKAERPLISVWHIRR